MTLVYHLPHDSENDSNFVAKFLSRYLVEEEVDLEGEIEILHEDRDVGSRYLYALTTTGGWFALHFAADPPTHLETGTHVRVTGVRVAQTLALSSSTTSVQTLAFALP